MVTFTLTPAGKLESVAVVMEDGGNIVEPAYPGDGAYPVYPVCDCGPQRVKAYYWTDGWGYPVRHPDINNEIEIP